MDPRTQMLLEAPIGSTLLRLALPNIVVMVMQASIGLIETYFVAKLGVDALAGLALVFPVFMLFQMISAGAMGGGILSSIARALGARQTDDANALVWHAVAIALGLGSATSAAVLVGGPALYALMGGEGASLAAAVLYSSIIFAGAVPLWLFNSLAAVIRGTGNIFFPATVVAVGAIVLIPLSPALIFGLGPLPRLGIIGGATAVVLYYTIGSIIFAAYLWSGRSVLQPRFVPPRLRWVLDARDSAGRRDLLADLDLDQCQHRGRDRPCRPDQPGGGCRLWHRRAAGISAGAAGVRPWRAAGRHGRHRDRRRRARPRAARRLDRRRHRRRS